MSPLSLVVSTNKALTHTNTNTNTNTNTKTKTKTNVLELPATR